MEIISSPADHYILDWWKNINFSRFFLNLAALAKIILAIPVTINGNTIF